MKIIFSEEMIFDDYEENKIIGSLIFIDLVSNIIVKSWNDSERYAKKRKNHFLIKI